MWRSLHGVLRCNFLYSTTKNVTAIFHKCCHSVACLYFAWAMWTLALTQRQQFHIVRISNPPVENVEVKFIPKQHFAVTLYVKDMLMDKPTRVWPYP